MYFQAAKAVEIKAIDGNGLEYVYEIKFSRSMTVTAYFTLKNAGRIAMNGALPKMSYCPIMKSLSKSSLLLWRMSISQRSSSKAGYSLVPPASEVSKIVSHVSNPPIRYHKSPFNLQTFSTPRADLETHGGQVPGDVPADGIIGPMSKYTFSASETPAEATKRSTLPPMTSRWPWTESQGFGD
jgi:hypothetical protein